MQPLIPPRYAQQINLLRVIPLPLVITIPIALAPINICHSNLSRPIAPTDNPCPAFPSG